MNRWVDVTERDWFFTEVTEASSIVLEDGEPLVSSLMYNRFMSDAPYLYQETIGVEGQKVFTLTHKITPTAANPLYVFVEGVQTVYKSVTNNGLDKTDVELYVSPRPGAVVSFSIVGKPVVDRFGKPGIAGNPQYPSHYLDYGDTYYYEPFSRQYNEYLYAYGRPLRRISVPDAQWDVSTGQGLAAMYIGNQTDAYIVSPSRFGGCIYLPYNLNGVTCRFTYNSMEDGIIKMRGGNFKSTVDTVLYNNRFFPNAYITRAEAFTLIDRLRRTFYSRFTDKDAPGAVNTQWVKTYEGQKVFKLDFNYIVGGLTNQLVVKLNGALKFRGIDFIEFDNHTVLWSSPLPAGQTVYFGYQKAASIRFDDVGTNITYYNDADDETIEANGTADVWWAKSVLAMEDETFSSGEYLVNGISINNYQDGSPVVDHMYNPVWSATGNGPARAYFMAKTVLKRAEAVAFLNRFRQWSMEKFK